MSSRNVVLRMSLGLLLLVQGLTLASSQTASADGGMTAVLQSIALPHIQNAPFSLVLVTEWARPMGNGGTYTVTNKRPILRDSAGRIYQERWTLVPKGSNARSQLTWIQISDSVAGVLYECTPSAHRCELNTLTGATTAHYEPDLVKTGPLPNGKGMRAHEDLGFSFIENVQVHGYRDSVTFNPGTYGNDLPMSTVREFSYAPSLGINLVSVVEAPQFGKQTFTGTQLETREPDPKFFRPPAGYVVVDRRQPNQPSE